MFGVSKILAQAAGVHLEVGKMTLQRIMGIADPAAYVNAGLE